MGNMREDPVVGHKTMRRPDGSHYHVPMTQAEADALLASIEADDARRNELMPTEDSARLMFFDAWLRLKDFGWKEAIYCPKDGSVFEAIEPGSSGVHACSYEGEWPKGSWWVHEDGHSCPSHPALYRKRKDANGTD